LLSVEANLWYQNKKEKKSQVLVAQTYNTQEAEIRRIVVQSQPGQIVQETLSWKRYNTQKGLVAIPVYSVELVLYRNE
jgi:ABC-type uncharacterized transport system auxiliary subunit